MKKLMIFGDSIIKGVTYSGQSYHLCQDHDFDTIAAHEFSGDPVLILADQPTRGIDVGATEFIRKKLVELSRSGIAVLLISADLAEVMELSDSLIVMHGGKIAAYFEDTSTLTDDVMGEYMLGLKHQSDEEIRRVCHD